ncbi:Gfo/Idh/MocA family oxidoreductase [Tardisphaera miroshnichenkoae]
MKIALLGHGFIARAHANAYLVSPRFFELREQPELSVVYGRDLGSLKAFAKRFGFKTYTTNLAEAISNGEVVDNCLPNYMHAAPTISALSEGKHVILEKPMAMNAKEAQKIVEAHKKAGEHVKGMVAFNYRFLPAVALAKELIDEGRLGNIHEYRAAYLHESLTRPSAKATWRQSKELSGTGALGDLGSHVLDMASYLVGTVKAVMGRTYTVKQELPSREGKMVSQEVDDAFAALLSFDSGAYGVVEASKVSPGMKNFFRFEVHGSKGSLTFNLERPNELRFFTFDDEQKISGFRTIMATDPSHPYGGLWWPPGHVLGWEHSIDIEVGHFLDCVASDKPVFPGATLEDGLLNQKIIDNVLLSSEKGQWVTM